MSACDGRAAASAPCSRPARGAVRAGALPGQVQLRKGETGRRYGGRGTPLPLAAPGRALRAQLPSSLPAPRTRRAASPASSPAASCLQEEVGKKGRRRMEEPEVNRYLNASSVCLQLLHLLPARDHTDRPQHPVGNLPPPCHRVCPGWGWGLRSRRPELGVRTKGEGEIIPSKPEKTRDPPGSQERGL